MRRTSLAAAVFAGTIALAALAPVAAVADPKAEVRPHRVKPGGTVTISVVCDPTSGKPPQYLTAYSQAFVKGEARLDLLPRGGDGRYGPAYEGTARVAPADNFPGSEGSPDAYRSDDLFGSGSDGSDPSSSDPYDSDTYDSDTYGSYGSDPSDSGAPSSDASRHGKSWSVNGSCPEGKDFTASFVVERKPKGGPHAGTGGSQGGVNSAALAGGGVLLSATIGLGVYVLRRHRSDS